jgi:hypothetical protein
VPSFVPPLEVFAPDSPSAPFPALRILADFATIAFRHQDRSRRRPAHDEADNRERNTRVTQALAGGPAEIVESTLDAGANLCSLMTVGKSKTEAGTGRQIPMTASVYQNLPFSFSSGDRRIGIADWNALQ